MVMTVTADLLAPTTTMGSVTLRVRDLDAMTAFYSAGIGLSVLAQTGGEAILGRDDRPLVILQHAPELAYAPADHAGLFHTAILFDTTADLAASLYSVARAYPGAFTGSADHLVSQAFYFDDPEGNGVELYWDRPRDQWRWVNGHVQMATNYLDPNAFVTAHLTDPAQLAGLTAAPLQVGHVHLKVGDVDVAEAFYIGVLGFAETARFGSQALFVSAGGYHHHVAMNTWQSRGAGPRTPGLGLGQVSVELADSDEVDAVAARLADRRIRFSFDGTALLAADPWNNQVRITAR
jgi:catechol 2,3-dioxygenase